MSAGAFGIYRYAASYDDAAIHPIRCQPETLAASVGGTLNTQAAGVANSPISARVSGGIRSLGLIARRVRLKAPAVGQPEGYLPSGVTTIPALQEAFYNACVKGAEVTYLGSTFTVVGRTTEYVN